MAVTAEATYFPGLDKCLSGAEPLVPWTSAYAAFSNLESALSNTTLESFISDNETRIRLARPFEPFPAPSQSTKRSYDAMTAQINAPKSLNNDYNLEQLKEDALWLSKDLKIDEVSALRCAIVEWRQRPADILLGKVQSGNNSQDLTQSYFGKSKASAGAVEEKSGVDFEDTELRRQRLLKVCLEERSAASACSALLVSLAAGISDNDLPATPTSPKTSTQTTWIMFQARLVHHDIVGKLKTCALSPCIQAATTLAKTLEGPAEWPTALKDRPELAVAYYDAAIQDLVNIMRVALALAFTPGTPISPADARDWFKLMGSTAFFSDLSPMSAAQNVYIPVLQCLVSITAAAVLKLPETIENIARRRDAAQNVNGPTYPDLGPVHYIADDSCVKEINLVLFQAADVGNKVAGPAIWAWSIITMIIRDHAQIDQAQAQHDEDSSDHESGRRPSSARTPSRAPSAMEKTWETLQAIELGNQREDPPQFNRACWPYRLVRARSVKLAACPIRRRSAGGAAGVVHARHANKKLFRRGRSPV
jgi:nuclear pore complex protein Nup188